MLVYKPLKLCTLTVVLDHIHFSPNVITFNCLLIYKFTILIHLCKSWTILQVIFLIICRQKSIWVAVSYFKIDAAIKKNIYLFGEINFIQQAYRCNALGIDHSSTYQYLHTVGHSDRHRETDCYCFPVQLFHMPLGRWVELEGICLFSLKSNILLYSNKCEQWRLYKQCKI
jgi:hypothetical protein